MNNYNLFYKEFAPFLSTLKETSFDDFHNVYLCKDTSQAVFNFDAFIRSRYPDGTIRPKSFDALLFYEKFVFCIEFKNEEPIKIDIHELKGKIKEGKEELVKLFTQLNIEKRDYNFIYCIVYKDCKTSFENYRYRVQKCAVEFSLEELKENAFVKEVSINSLTFFTKEFQKLLKKELKC